jgi:hypothetical protein
LYHAAGGEFSWYWIAESVVRDLGVSTRSLIVEKADEMFGPVGATIYPARSRSLDPRSHRELGWSLGHLDMLSLRLILARTATWTQSDRQPAGCPDPSQLHQALRVQ